jgi:tetratricopeptide (TPR) repeat protein
MDLLTWVRSHLSPKYRANSLYRRGMARAKAGRHEAAIDDYTEVIDLTNVDPNIKATALYNRALVYSALSKTPAAIIDLQQILAMDAVSETVKTEARRKVLRMGRSSDREAAQSDATTSESSTAVRSAGKTKTADGTRRAKS